MMRSVSRLLGPGAEPPVAVVSHAFAHEKKESCRYKKIHGDVRARACTLSVGEGSGGVFGKREKFIKSGRVHNAQRTSPSARRGKGRDTCSSGPKSTSNEEEVDTLPDTFNPSDESAPEGASTWRNHHDDPDDSDEPHFFASPAKSRSGRSRRNSSHVRRYANEGDGDRDPTAKAYDSNDGGEEHEGHSSVSDHSDCMPLSPLKRNPSRFERHASRPRGPFLRPRRKPRIARHEDVEEETLVVTREKTWRPLCTSCKRRRGQRSPPPPRRRGGIPERHRLRARSSRKCRDQRSGVSGKLSVSNSYKAEIARLTNENIMLKQREEQSWFTANDSEEDDIREKDADGASPQASTSGSCCRRRVTLPSAQRKSWPLSLDKETVARIQKELSTRTLGNPLHPILEASRKQRSRPECASMSHLPSYARKYAWGAASGNSGVDIVLPELLVQGGFLWKIPFHNSGAPKRRWLQIKPAEGLLTTPSGRLVVRPTVSRRGRGFSPKNTHDNSRYGGDYGDSASLASTPVTNVRVAWPLALVWVDPDRDLHKFPPREMAIDEIVGVVRGHVTPAFRQQAEHHGIHTLSPPELCFSLTGHDRTLDLACDGLPEVREWIQALAYVALKVDHEALAIADPAKDHVPASPMVLFPTHSTTLSHDSEALNSITPIGPRRRGTMRSTDAGFPSLPRPDAVMNTLVGESPSQQQPSSKKIDPHREKETEGTRAWSSRTIRAWRRRIFAAVSRGDTPEVVALFDQGCPVDIVQKGTGDTVLLLACRMGDVSLASECLRRGSTNDPHPELGQTALQAAVAAGQEQCVRLLLETVAPSHSDAVMSNHRDHNKETPLHVASRRGYSGIVDRLLHHGADLSLVDRYDNTPLHAAAGSGNADALASLLDAGGDAVMEEKNKRGNSALHAAAASGHLPCVQMLLGSAAEPNIPNVEGNTPFALASIGGHLAVTRLIRQYAPTARTTLGGDAHTQTYGLASALNGAAADVLPRPRASGSLSTRANSLEHPIRVLEHRHYSAASASHRQVQSDRAVSSEPVISKTANKERKTEAPSSDPPAYGTLFEGLQVYVVGDRGPVGSKRRYSPVDGMFSTKNPIAAVTPTGCIDHSSFQLDEFPRALQSTSSESTTKRENVPAAPSTLARFPSPRDSKILVINGVDCGEVGSGDSSKSSLEVANGISRSEVLASAAKRVASSEGEAAGAMRSWMISQGQEAHVTTDVHTGDRNVVVGDVGTGIPALEALEEVEMWPSVSETTLKGGGADEDEKEAAPRRQNSFVLSSQGGDDELSGLWRVFFSEGYPYYLHEASGHSQWEDPRDR